MLAILCGVGCAGDPSGQALCSLCRLVVDEYHLMPDPRRAPGSRLADCLEAGRALSDAHKGTRKFASLSYDMEIKCGGDHMLPGWYRIRVARVLLGCFNCRVENKHDIYSSRIRHRIHYAFTFLVSY